MEKPDDLIRRVLVMAGAHDGIETVILTGSRAREERVDALSDLDLELIGPAVPDLAGDDDWLTPLGPRLVALHLSNDEPDEPDWPTCLVVLAGGRKIDFTLAGPARISDLVEHGLDDLYRRGYQVLHDETGRTAALAPCPFSAPSTEAPDAEAFDAHQREFWFEATQVPIYLARDDLWPAASREADMRALLLGMLEWNTHARHGEAVDTWHNGHHLAEWLPPDYRARLAAVHGSYDRAGLAAALRALSDLYAEVTTDTARRLGLVDHALHTQVIEHIDTVLQHTPAAATGPQPAPAEPVDAVLVVDMQAGFVTGAEAAPHSTALVDAVDTLVSRARAAGANVVHLRNAGPPGALDEPGNMSWELHRAPHSGEPVIDKSEDDGFAGTQLDHELRERGVRRLVICGLMSEMCVAATARGALARGYGVVLPHTAHATYDVPAGPGPSPSVSASLAARAAEWSLGDEIEIVANPMAVEFNSTG